MGLRQILLSLLLGLTVCGVLAAQANDLQSAERETFPAGVLQHFREQIQPLLRLRWKDSELVIDEAYWDETNKGKSENELIENEIQKLADRFKLPGGNDQLKNRRAEIQKRMEDSIRQKFANSPIVGRLFSQLSNAVLLQDGRGGGTSSSRHSYSFKSQQLRGELDCSDGAFHLQLAEKDAPHQNLRVTNVGGKVKLILDCKGRTIVLSQDDTGVRVVDSGAGDGPISLDSESMLELYKNNRGYCENTLFAWLDHMGLVPPYQLKSPKIVAYVTDRLSNPTGDGEKAAQLFADLDSAEYAVRNAAANEIAESYQEYRELIDEYLAKPGISFEASAALNKIVARSGSNDEIVAFVSALKLMESPDYLIELFDIAPEDSHDEIAKQLKQLTGINHGTDSAAWNEWSASE